MIGLQLCPFAKAVHVKEQIRYLVTEAATPQELADELVRELRTLAACTAEEIDTTLIIHPAVLQDFFEYNDFLGVAEDIVAGLGLEGEIQVASFHPDYQFAGTRLEDIENATNRSPYPMLHLLREASIERALAGFPEAERIYQNNIETLRRLGPEGWAQLQARWLGRGPVDAERTIGVEDVQTGTRFQP